MKLNKQKLGKIQVTLGIILLLVTIIGSYFVMSQVFYQGILINGAFVITEKWGDAANLDVDDASQEADLERVAEVTSIIIIISSLYKYALYIFGLGVFMLLVLSGILILQGLTNLAKK